MRRAFAVLTVLCVMSSQALAWSDAGHRIVASIAFRRLTPNEQTKVVAILRNHPRFQDDFLDKMPADTPDEDQNEWLFQQASFWPDIARGFKGDDRTRYHHSNWHYIPVPSYLNDDDAKALEGRIKVNVSLDPPARPEESMNAIQTIRLARKMLTDTDVAAPDKAIMLSWLSHVVGDIHQPLHSTNLFSSKLFPEGDRGGNSITTRQRGNLHSLWDGFLGGKMSLKEARQDALKLLAERDLVRAGERGAMSLDEKVWLDESRIFATDYAYGPLMPHLRNLENEGGELQPITLTEDYLLTGGAMSRLRVVLAGYRLAAVLRQIVD